MAGKSTLSLSKHKYSYSKKTGTPLYASPEQQIEGAYYNSKSDVYSLGIILLEMISKFQTFHEKIKKIPMFKDKGIIDESLVRGFPQETKLIKILTKHDMELRPSSSRVKDLPEFLEWAKEIHKIYKIFDQNSKTSEPDTLSTSARDTKVMSAS